MATVFLVWFLLSTLFLPSQSVGSTGASPPIQVSNSPGAFGAKDSAKITVRPSLYSTEGGKFETPAKVSIAINENDKIIPVFRDKLKKGTDDKNAIEFTGGSFFGNKWQGAGKETKESKAHVQQQLIKWLKPSSEYHYVKIVDADGKQKSRIKRIKNKATAEYYDMYEVDDASENQGLFPLFEIFEVVLIFIVFICCGGICCICIVLWYLLYSFQYQSKN
eukprot:343407_1